MHYSRNALFIVTNFTINRNANKTRIWNQVKTSRYQV